MFLPIGDEPNPTGFTPWVTWALIGANVAVYLLVTVPLSMAAVDVADPLLVEYIRLLAPELPRGVPLSVVLRDLSAYDLFVYEHGYKPGAPEVTDLLAAMFLHGGFMHLAGNMLFLWIYGDNVEHRLGRLGYLLTYLATGAAATLAFAMVAGSSMRPLVGASGAISGLLGLYFLLFPRNRVKVFLFLFPFFANVVRLPARWVLGLYVVVDNLLPVIIGVQGSVAYGAHLGGFAAGLLIAWGGERCGWCWPWQDPLWRIGSRRRPSRVEEHGGRTALGDLLYAIDHGDRATALADAAALTREQVRRIQPGDCVRLATWLEESGHPVAATSLLRKCLAAHPQSTGLAPVYLRLGLMRLSQGQPTAAYQHLLAVFDHSPDPETLAAAVSALQRLDSGRLRVE